MVDSTSLFVRDPFYYHREYGNDVKIGPSDDTWAHTAQRLGLVALPFISLYKPLSFPLSLGLGGLRTWTAIAELQESLYLQDLSRSSYALLQTAVAITGLAGTIFAHPLGMLITTGQDLSIEAAHLVEHLEAGEYKSALEDTLGVANNALYLALFLHGGLEWGIASLAMQTLIALYYSYHEFEQGHHLEASAHLTMAFIRGGQLSVAIRPYTKEMCARMVSRCFFFGYDVLDPLEAHKRMKALESKVPLSTLECRDASGQPLDAIYLASTAPHKTDHVVVFAETTSYQDRIRADGSLPSQYQHFLDEGVSVVLWNPACSENIESKRYAQDLVSVLKGLEQKQPSKIVIKGHCATVEPTISAAVDSGLQNLSLILDRGYANVRALARSFTPLSELPCIAEVIEERFSCNGEEKLKQFSGNVIFVAPENPDADQITYWKGVNLTYQMHDIRGGKDPFVRMDKGTSDHWSPWNAGEYSQITKHLKEFGVMPLNALDAPQNIPLERPPLTFFQRTILHWLIKSNY